MSVVHHDQPLLTLDPPPKRIAVLRALFLGDLLCSTPALRALHQRFPQAELTLITLPWAYELTRRLPYIQRLEHFPGYPGIGEVEHRPERTALFFSQARQSSYDLVLQMHGDGTASNGFVSDMDGWMSVGYRNPGITPPDSRLTLSLPYDPDEHEVQRWLRLVGLLGAETSNTSLDMPITPAEWEQAHTLLSARRGAGPLVGLHTGAKDAARRWPAERFALLADTLVERYHARIVLTGSENERSITSSVRRAMRHPALDLTGRTDLGVFAAVIGGLDLLVTNDTSASHIAAARETRSVVIFGPTRPAQWRPLNIHLHRVVSGATATDDGLTSRTEQRATLHPLTWSLQSSISMITVETVLAECAELLEPSLSAL